MDMEEVDTLCADAAKVTTLGGRVVISAARQQVNVICGFIIQRNVSLLHINVCTYIYFKFIYLKISAVFIQKTTQFWLYVHFNK